MNFPFDDDDFLEPERAPSRQERDGLREFVRALPLIPPPDIFARLEQLGYKGQDEPRRALSLLAYRHVRRLKRLHVDGETRRLLPPKQNTLLVGPTGSGKTFLIESLFQQLFHLPTLIVDVTSFTESGYVGDDVHTILTRLVYAAEGDLLLAQCGVICLDEFDKLASSTSNARFAGEGTTKDVSGYGVQRELLKMLEGKDVMVPMDFGASAYGQRAPLSTLDIPFIACGTFSGMDDVLKATSKSIGFKDKANNAEAGSPVLEEIEGFQRYGFLPELMGRFARIVRFQSLSAATLKQILHDNVLPQFVREFQLEGLHLNVTDGALDFIIERSLKRGTGARGLHANLVAAVEQAAFDNFQRVTNAEIVIEVARGNLRSELRKRA
ncbi:MAG: AAA family ATPase [Acidobacteria bacterium]|nr:AAA family ATPase [Acidobacteriota bacterium]MBI3422446.1 AAA family ATPase [Acidobacteriota bacterium]